MRAARSTGVVMASLAMREGGGADLPRGRLLVWRNGYEELATACCYFGHLPLALSDTHIT